MIKLFIDSDIIIDFLSQREPFFAESVHLFNELANNPNIKAYSSAIVFANVTYILNKQIGKQIARQKLIELRQLIDIVPTNQLIVDSALHSNIQDFEDALQIKSAESFGINYILTRNHKDYTNTILTVYDCVGFLTFYHQT